jgi:polysaccharide export outer membrane protein
MVNSKDPELVQMFNLPMVSYQVTSMGYLGGQQRMLGYLVDKNGNIKFPQLGEVNVRGLNRFELSDLISNELKERGLVNDAVVTVQFLNFKVSVMGEVVRPGTFEVDSDRITLLDALSLAGDMTIYGRRDNVRVIREENGERTVAIVDLRSRNLMNSPYYYLKQNDIVYVEPNKARAGQREINQNRSVSTFASILSVLASLASLAVVIFR